MSSVHGKIDPLAPSEFSGLFPNTIKADSIEIDASCKHVWQHMVKFEEYDSWNPFTPRVSVARLEMGAAVTMRVEWPRSSQSIFDFPPDIDAQIEYISVLEPGRALAYGGYALHPSFLQFERLQFLEPLGSDSCTYHTFDRFSGLFNPVNNLIFGKRIREGFNLAARGLKRVTESRSRPTTAASGTDGATANRGRHEGEL
jgi:hypothetical protein